MARYQPGPYRDLAESRAAKGVWPFLNQSDTIAKMEAASKLGRPAVEALEEDLLDRFGELVLVDRVKQMIGHMARQIMEVRGWRIDIQNVKITNGGPFSRGTRYRRADKVTLRVYQSAIDPRRFALTLKADTSILERGRGKGRDHWISRGVVKDRLRLFVLYGVRDIDRTLDEIKTKGFATVRVERMLRGPRSAQASRSLVERIRSRIEPLGGVDLPELPDEPIREPPRFD